MPRPKLHSDEAILSAAQHVLLSKGPATFTLTDVANAVGISRAALIQRFRDKATLHNEVMKKMTQEVRDYFAAQPVEKGLVPLWAMLKELIGGMGEGEDTAGYLLLQWADIHDPALLELARERNRLVAEAIELRLPDRPHAPSETASLIQAVIQGACMQWLIAREGSVAVFMTNQTRRALKKLYPEQNFD